MKLFLIFTLLNFSCVYGQNDLTNLYNKIDTEQREIISLIVNLKKQLSATKDTLLQQAFQSEIDSLIIVTDKLEEQCLATDFAFIGRNPSVQKSLELLSTKMWTQQAGKYCDAFFALFNQLTTELKQSELGVQTRKALVSFKNSQVGYQAPNFQLADINSKPIDLKSIVSDTYVLLDFWASWCGPCRKDIPFLKQLVNRFSPDLKVIAISRDENLSSWQRAINEENTTQWTHISTKQNSNTILDNYFVWAIPVKVLIDKQGKIIGRWRGSGEENKSDLLKILSNTLLQKQ